MSQNFKTILLQRINFLSMKATLDLSSVQHCVYYEEIMILEVGFIVLLEISERLRKWYFL